MVSSTSSPHVIVDREDLELTMAERPGRPLVMIDIAVPRDVDPTAREVPGVALYDMDDLQRAVARGRSVREAEAVRARALVDEEVERFGRWLTSLEVVPTIAALRERGEEVVQTVLRENEHRWESLSPGDRERLTVMARAVVRRLLHEPTLRLKASATDDEDDAAYVHVQALRDLFGLDLPAPELEERVAEVTELEARRAARLSRPMKLGTRGSALALAQAGLVRDRIAALGHEVELVVIRTSGDERPAGEPAPETSDKERFVKEIEEALLDGRIDMAVHSAKDVPGELPDGLAIVGVPERADPRDALCGARTLDELPEGAAVGTASVRRRSQLLAARPDLDVREVRGNVDTRLRKLADGDYDALVLAAAGLARLERDEGTRGRRRRDAARARAGLPGAGGPHRGRGRRRAGRGAHRLRRPGGADRRARPGGPPGGHLRHAGRRVRAAGGRRAGAARLRGHAGRRRPGSATRSQGPAKEPAALGAAVGERMLAAGARQVLDD